MAKLYYGNGNCTIEGSNIRVIIIRFRGAIEIDDKTSDSFAITTQKNGIMIIPLKEGTLNNLFDYVGEFKIISANAVDTNGDKVSITIHRVMDYVELLNTKAEDMTTKSEDLSATHISGKRVAKTILKQPYIPNLHTSGHSSGLYLQDGTRYEGYYHLHLADNAAMTGKEHSEDSQDLYFKTGKPTKNPSLVPYGAIEARKRRKAALRQSKRSRGRY
tara:strand:+ start:634 stop:1284 length:651 start_codon:yes stop_codon:yes gene_type:complete